MEKVEVVATSHFSDSRIGSISRKQRLFIPVQVAEDLHSIGLVQYPKTPATLQRNPQIGPLAAGGAELLASLPAVQALQPKTVIRFRGQDGPQSPSMTPTDAQNLPMSSMPAMSNGGESMPKKRGRPSKASAGPKTNGQPESTASIE